jgi:hypothetical protein
MVARDWLKRLGVLAAVLLLSSCYIPDKFRSELRLSKYGDYALTFKGDLMYAPILDDYRKNKIKPAIVVRANAMKPSDAQILAELGLGMEGEFRITTDANVVKHNATVVKPFGTSKVYIWTIENALSPMPELVMIRDVDPSRPLAPRPSEAE